MFANGFLSGESLLRHNFIDHYDKLITQAIVVIEESPLAQRNAHDF